MGYTVLYIAFGIVALWLLGEVLLQYKARLRWRVLAFAGFFGVVLGVVLPNAAVIILGAAAFGMGQTFVTLSYRRGFSAGWAFGGRPGSSRRRKGCGAPASVAIATAGEAEAGLAGGADPAYDAGQQGHPVPESGEFGFFGANHISGMQETFLQRSPVYSPEPLREDTGEYGIYHDRGPHAPAARTSGGAEGYDAHGQGHGHGQGYEREWQPQPQWQNAANPTVYQEPFPQQEFAAYRDDSIYGDGYEERPYQEQQSWSGYHQEQYQGFYAYQQPQGHAYDPYAEQHAQAAYAYDHPPVGVWPPQADRGEHAYIPQQTPPTHDDPQPQYPDPYDPYRY
jgi:hypothetical protein